jgi:biotin carboxyl carrier protein
VRRLEDGRIEVRSPSVGIWRGAPSAGAYVRTGVPIGAIEILGVLAEVEMDGAAGVVAEVRDPERAHKPVGYGDWMMTIDPKTAGGEAAPEPSRAAEVSGLLFRSPMSGRFYRRPGLGKPPFVEEGDEIGPGTTVCLLEVMKTFNRVTYGEGRARVVRILVADGDDLSADDPILEVEPI